MNESEIFNVIREAMESTGQPIPKTEEEITSFLESQSSVPPCALPSSLEGSEVLKRILEQETVTSFSQSPSSSSQIAEGMAMAARNGADKLSPDVLERMKRNRKKNRDED